MKNMMPFDYINSLDSTNSQNNGHNIAGIWFLFICLCALDHGFTRTIDMAKRSSTKTRYRLMRPVNEWKLQHVKIDTLWVLI